MVAAAKRRPSAPHLAALPAGVMWVNILRLRGHTMGYTDFARLIAPLGLASAVSSLIVLAAQFYIV
jgi:hypothetical protein